MYTSGSHSVLPDLELVRTADSWSFPRTAESDTDSEPSSQHINPRPGAPNTY